MDYNLLTHTYINHTPLLNNAHDNFIIYLSYNSNIYY